MSNPDSPNLIAGMLAIHAVITRSLNVAATGCGSFAQQSVAGADSHDGLMSYIHCLVSVLGGHHGTEDELAFPVFQKMLDAPYDLLSQQHLVVHSLLDEAKAGVESVAAEPGAAAPWAKLHQLVSRIEEFWHAHIAIEEEHFTMDRFAALMPPDEHRRLIELFSGHMRQVTGPDYLVVPFLLYNSAPDKRLIFSSELPPMVTEQLVPVVWKEKWAPMQPFLLT
jgi:hypothetical protein